MYLEGKKEKKKERKKTFLTESGPPVLIRPRWRQLSSSRDHQLLWKSSEHIQWLPSSGESPLVAQWMTVPSLIHLPLEGRQPYRSPLPLTSSYPLPPPLVTPIIHYFIQSPIRRKHSPLLFFAICFELLYLHPHFSIKSELPFPQPFAHSSKRLFLLEPFAWCKVPHNLKLPNTPQSPNSTSWRRPDRAHPSVLAVGHNLLVAIFCFFPAPGSSEALIK